MKLIKNSVFSVFFSLDWNLQVNHSTCKFLQVNHSLASSYKLTIFCKKLASSYKITIRSRPGQRTRRLSPLDYERASEFSCKNYAKLFRISFLSQIWYQIIAMLSAALAIFVSIFTIKWSVFETSTHRMTKWGRLNYQF